MNFSDLVDMYKEQNSCYDKTNEFYQALHSYCQTHELIELDTLDEIIDASKEYNYAF